MKLGFSPISAAMLDLDSAFRLAGELELDFVELSFDLFEVLPDLQPVAEVKELTSSTGIGTTVHLSYLDLNLASLNPTARRAAVERTQRGLEYASQIGAHCGVLHSGLNLVPFEQARMLALTALQESLSAIEGSDVKVALENLVLTEEDVIRNSEELAEITDRHGMSNCLDFGHANVEGVAKGEDLIPVYIESMGKNLIHLHLHNNSGAGDEHKSTSEGTIDYARVRDLLGDFSGTACLEITGGADDVRESVRHVRELGLVPA